MDIRLIIEVTSNMNIGAYSAALFSKLLVANGVVMNDTVRFLLVTIAGGLVACVFGVLIGF